MSISTFSIDDAQNQLQELISEVTKSHQPIRITGNHSNAIILAEEDWSSIQETLYLLSIPDMRESIFICLIICIEAQSVRL